MRDKLLDRVIRMYGFEHEVTINFAGYYKAKTNNGSYKHSYKSLLFAVEALERANIEEE